MIEIDGVKLNKECILLKGNISDPPTYENCCQCEFWEACHDLYNSSLTLRYGNPELIDKFSDYIEKNRTLRDKLLNSIKNSHYGSWSTVNASDRKPSRNVTDVLNGEYTQDQEIPSEKSPMHYGFKMAKYVDDLDKSSLYDCKMKSFDFPFDSERFKEILNNPNIKRGRAIPDSMPDLKLEKIQVSSIYGQFGNNPDSNSRKKKLFISQPFHGVSEEEILSERSRIIKYLDSSHIYLRNTSMTINMLEWEVIDQYHVEDAPPDASRLWYLAHSIQLMSEADLVYFANGWNKAKGCLVEYKVARLYNIPYIVACYPLM